MGRSVFMQVGMEANVKIESKNGCFEEWGSWKIVSNLEPLEDNVSCLEQEVKDLKVWLKESLASQMTLDDDVSLLKR
ncbi:hypothetical protein KI387_015758, partial [Taxus chinensis]